MICQVTRNIRTTPNPLLRFRRSSLEKFNHSFWSLASHASYLHVIHHSLTVITWCCCSDTSTTGEKICTPHTKSLTVTSSAPTFRVCAPNATVITMTTSGELMEYGLKTKFVEHDSGPKFSWLWKTRSSQNWLNDTWILWTFKSSQVKAFWRF